MSALPADVEALRLRTRAFIRTEAIPSEPAPGERLTEDKRRELVAAFKVPVHPVSPPASPEAP